MARVNLNSLQQRTLSALILAPSFGAIVWFGGIVFVASLVAAAAIAVYEWRNLIIKLSGSLVAPLIGGVLYISISVYSFYLCRELGGAHIILLLFMVWASDIGAYFMGKFIGGPKLLPQVSPNKTWAGLGGAVLCPIIVLFAFFIVYNDLDISSFTIDPYTIALLFIVGGIIGLLGQVGDLLMSFMKRLAGVKDTGHIIPGHGGLLDRIDSLLLVTPVFYVLIKSISVIMGVSS